MKKLILSATLAAFMVSSSAYAISIQGGAGAWRENPSGWIEYKTSNLGGTGVGAKTHIDLKNDLNFSSKTKAFGWIAIKGIPILPDVRVQYTPMKFSGSGTPDVDFTFGKISVSAKDKIDAEFRANQIDVTLTYKFPFIGSLSDGAFELNWGSDIKIIDSYAKVKDITQNIEDSKSATIPVPMLHLDGVLQPVKEAAFEFSGNWIGYKGSQFYDVNGELKIYPIRNLFVGIGYRYQRLKIDDISDVSSDIKFKGAFAEAGFRF